MQPLPPDLSKTGASVLASVRVGLALILDTISPDSCPIPRGHGLIVTNSTVS